MFGGIWHECYFDCLAASYIRGKLEQSMMAAQMVLLSGLKIKDMGNDGKEGIGGEGMLEATTILSSPLSLLLWRTQGREWEVEHMDEAIASHPHNT